MDMFWIRKGLSRFRCVGKDGCGQKFENREEFLAHRATLPTRTDLTKEERQEMARSSMKNTMKSKPFEG